MDSVKVMPCTESKKADAECIGGEYLAYIDEEELAKSGNQFDTVLDKVSAEHDIACLINVLKVGGFWVLLGGVAKPFNMSALQLLISRYSVAGYMIGGVPETQATLDFCAEHQVVLEYSVIHNAKDADAHFKATMAGIPSLGPNARSLILPCSRRFLMRPRQLSSFVVPVLAYGSLRP